MGRDNFEGERTSHDKVSRHSAVICAKTAAESSEMPFGSRTLVGSRNHVLDGVQIPHGSGQF